MGKNEMVTKENNALVPAGLLGEMVALSEQAAGFEGIGIDDMAIPFIQILQSGSPQLKRGEQKIDGAEEGDFYNTVTGEVYKGVIKLVPCAYKKSFNEWVPRDNGGGFVKEHLSADILTKTYKNDKYQDMLENGNQIVTTASHFCLLVKEDGTFERVIVPFTSTQLKKSRKWNSIMASRMLSKADGSKFTPRTFAFTYDCESVPESNTHGQWSGWKIGNPEIVQDAEVFTAAKMFSEQVRAGEVEVAPPSDDGEQTTNNLGDADVI